MSKKYDVKLTEGPKKMVSLLPKNCFFSFWENKVALVS